VRRHRLHAAFWAVDGRAVWVLSRSGVRTKALARRVGGLYASMPLPVGSGAWDAPTFRACADQFLDYRGEPGTVRADGRVVR